MARRASQAIARMRDALNAFVIRGVSSNIAFQAALMQHPRFVSGNFNTGLIAEEYPKGFNAVDVPHDDPAMLIVRRRRHAPPVSGAQCHHQRPDAGPRVQAGRRLRRPCSTTAPASSEVAATRRDGGWDVDVRRRDATRSAPTGSSAQSLYQGTLNGEPFCMQVERHGLGTACSTGAPRPTCMVMTARAAELQALMPLQGAARHVEVPALADARPADADRRQPPARRSRPARCWPRSRR